MTTPTPTAGTPSERSPASVAARWLHPRRKRFWLIALLLLYTLGGFFAVPALVQRLAVDAILDGAGREATIERVRFNPYVLSLEVEGFAVRDTDGARLASFERLFVNFQLSSLFRWAWTFREISVDGPYQLIERFAPGDSRLTRLLADMHERAAEPDPAAQPAGLPRFLVHELNLKEGRLHFRDSVPAEPVELEFGPITVSVQELNALPDRSGQQSVNIVFPNDLIVTWQGSLSLGPLQSEGSFSVEGAYLQKTTTYLKPVLPLQSVDADLAVGAKYRVAEQADGSLDIELDDLEARLTQVAVTGLTPATEFAAFRSLELLGGSLRYPENTLQFSSVRLSEPRFETWLDEAGRLNLLQLVPRDSSDQDQEQAQSGSAPSDATSGSVPADAANAGGGWRLGIEEFVLEGGRLGFEDRSIEPPAALRLQAIALTASAISNEAGAEFPLTLAAGLEQGGTLGFDGGVSVLPALSIHGTLNAAAIPLGLAQAYLQQQLNLRIEAGTLDSTVELTLRPDQTVAADGTLAVAGLRVDDTLEQRPLVGWERLVVDRFETDTAAASLSVSQLQFHQPFGRVVINADKTTNLSALARDQPDAEDGAQPTATDVAASDAAASSSAGADSAPSDPAPAQAAPAYAVVLGNVLVQDGSLDFSDLSLPLPFATDIVELGGTISTIDSRSAEPANVRLEGQVEDYGLARIDGGINLMDPLRTTNITMEFRNLLMSNLSPYTVEFAGREIAEGKLDLNLVYRIDDGLMQGQNDIVMSDLVLGDKVKHPGAASLPLGLAVALLKDANGVIDIELPVAGDVNDPQFRIGGVIWQAFAGLITKIVTAPFRLLGRLVGADTEDLGRFQFLAGRADLTPPEMEKIALLQRALRERPELVIEVSGGFVAAVDVPALQYQQLRGVVLARIGDSVPLEGEEVRLLDERLRSALEALFAERFPAIPLTWLEDAHTTTPADAPEAEAVMDELAYAADLRDRLLASEPVGQAELKDLANARAEAIREAFLANGEFAAEQITVTAPAETETEAEGDDWVVMELGLAVP